MNIVIQVYTLSFEIPRKHNRGNSEQQRLPSLRLVVEDRETQKNPIGGRFHGGRLL